jgi:diacylglycerol kinase (ATP)
MKTLFIVNSTKKTASGVVDHLAHLLADDDVSFSYTDHSGHATEICKALSPDVELIVAVGGDGTINECVNGIMQLSHKPALAVLPFGTGNDFVKSALTYENHEQFIQARDQGKVKSIDVGQMDYNGSSEYFINIADAGMGPFAVKLMEKSPGWLPGKVKFSQAILRSLLLYKKGELAVESEGFGWKGVAYAIIVANGKYFGGGLGIAPSAELDSGIFEGVIIGDVSTADYIKQVSRLRKALPLNHPEVTYFKAKELSITGVGAMEKDGELGNELPVKITCLPQAMNLLVLEP